MDDVRVSGNLAVIGEATTVRSWSGVSVSPPAASSGWVWFAFTYLPPALLVGREARMH